MSGLSARRGEGLGRARPRGRRACSRRCRSRRSPRSTASRSAAAASSRSRATSATRRARAKLGQPEINLGIVPGWGGTQRLARVCGIGVAKDLIFTGRTVDAEEALRIGLVNALADPVLDKALETAHELAAKSPVALALAKRLVNMSPGALDTEADEFGELFASEDASEGLTAFVEKRAAELRRPLAQLHESCLRVSRRRSRDRHRREAGARPRSSLASRGGQRRNRRCLAV